MNYHDYDIIEYEKHQKHNYDANQGFPLLTAQNTLSCDSGLSSRHTAIQPSHFENEPSTSSSNDCTTDRRSRTLEKNRRAAARCRQRKKLWVEELTRQHEQSKQRNELLQEMVAGLREEIYSLKNQLLVHDGCNCQAVKEYIKMSLVNDVIQKSKGPGTE
ncbi:hypothetical protein BJV82DRAFT_685556 [Fennellomyces sp. T-0311]|nr:hypothetical protein BJV82DRAFT_685556 [Fennellomyces sp. T-0311]